MRMARPVSIVACSLLAACATGTTDLDRWTNEPRERSDARPQDVEAEAKAPADQALKQANNPLADIKALSLHNYYIPDLSGTDESANTFWLRYAQPVEIGDSTWLVRGSLPLSTVPTGVDEAESGLGDANVFATYLFETDDPGLSFGAGPLLGLPTATDDALGSDQWSAGAAVVLFDSRSSLFQYGGLVTYQHGIGGSDEDPDVNLMAVQPFTFLQLGNGFYFRNSGAWAFDLERGYYSVPLGAGIGKVVPTEHVVINMFLEPQYTVLHDGPGQPEFQVFVGFNMQFTGGERPR